MVASLVVLNFSEFLYKFVCLSQRIERLLRIYFCIFFENFSKYLAVLDRNLLVFDWVYVKEINIFSPRIDDLVVIEILERNVKEHFV